MLTTFEVAWLRLVFVLSSLSHVHHLFVWQRTIAAIICPALAISESWVRRIRTYSLFHWSFGFRFARPERPTALSPGHCPGLSAVEAVALKGQKHSRIYFKLLPFQGVNSLEIDYPGCRFACPGLCAFGLSGRTRPNPELELFHYQSTRYFVC